MTTLNLPVTLRAHISGGHAKLIRYAQTTERESGLLGYYDRLVDAVYPWPALPAGAVIDTAYTKIWIQDALLQYFSKSIGGGADVTKLANYNNRIVANDVVLAASSGFDRDAALLDRDVKVGDIVKVRGINEASDSVTLWTYVKSLIAETVAGVVGDISVDADNAATQSESSSHAFISGPINCVTITDNDTSYDGTPAGLITETYDLLVTQASAGGDFTTATIRVISGSGTDDVTAVTPAAKGSPTTIGTRGLTVTFDVTSSGACSASATTEDIPPEDLAVGQRWRVTVNQAFTQPTPLAAGSYTGAEDTTYVITVSRGGKFSSSTKPQITVTTTNGIDVSGPTNVTTSGGNVAVGSFGVLVHFTGTDLVKGDRYYIAVTGTADGAIKVIELGHNLDTTIDADSELDLTLFILNPLLQIPMNQVLSPPDTNWEMSATDITMQSGITAFDPSWTNLGVEEALPVYSESTQVYGKVYCDVRYWLNTLINTVGTIDDPTVLDTVITGALDPDNPLKWGVSKALECAAGQEVKFTSVMDPNTATSWNAVLALLENRDNVYGLVPLTRDLTVLNAFADHVKQMSEVEQGLWRKLWLSLAGVPEIPIVSAGSTVSGHEAATTSDGAVALGVVEDDPNTAGTQYTVVRCTSGNADFLTNAVAAGDIVRLLYTTDGFGTTLYSEYVVASVSSENELLLSSGPDSGISVPAKFEVWRNLSAAQESAEIAKHAASWGDRRICAVWPDTITNAGVSMEGYFLCASLAGLTSGVYLHQSVSNMTIPGYDDASRTTFKFSRTQLNTMAAAGAWIVTQDLNGLVLTDGRVFTRGAYTTGDTADINQREEVLTRNVDSIMYQFTDVFAAFEGISNITPTMQSMLLSATTGLIEGLKTSGATQALGGQLISATIASLQPSLLTPDKFVLTMDLVVPDPFDSVTTQLTIGGSSLTANVATSNGSV